MTGRIPVNIRIGHNTVCADVEFPAPVRVQAARADVGLITGAVHIIHKNAGHFCKNLPWRFFGDIGVDVLNIDDLRFFTAPDKPVLGLWEPGNIFSLYPYIDFLQLFGWKGIGVYLSANRKGKKWSAKPTSNLFSLNSI